MKDYLLHTLSPGAFEELVVRICHEILGFGTISFSSGKDGGRDAFFDSTAQRFPSVAEPWTGKFVIQAKHTERADAMGARLRINVVPARPSQVEFSVTTPVAALRPRTASIRGSPGPRTRHPEV